MVDSLCSTTCSLAILGIVFSSMAFAQQVEPFPYSGIQEAYLFNPGGIINEGVRLEMEFLCSDQRVVKQFVGLLDGRAFDFTDFSRRVSATMLTGTACDTPENRDALVIYESRIIEALSGSYAGDLFSTLAAAQMYLDVKNGRYPRLHTLEHCISNLNRMISEPSLGRDPEYEALVLDQATESIAVLTDRGLDHANFVLPFAEDFPSYFTAEARDNLLDRFLGANESLSRCMRDTSRVGTLPESVGSILGGGVLASIEAAVHLAGAGMVWESARRPPGGNLQSQRWTWSDVGAGLYAQVYNSDGFRLGLYCSMSYTRGFIFYTDPGGDAETFILSDGSRSLEMQGRIRFLFNDGDPLLTRILSESSSADEASPVFDLLQGANTITVTRADGTDLRFPAEGSNALLEQFRAACAGARNSD